MLIDSHCHIINEKFPNIGGVIREARLAGVEKMIMPTGTLDEAVRAIDAAKKFDQYAMVGIHPEAIESAGDIEASIKKERKIVTQGGSRVVGIGEIGLDFYFDKEKKTKDKQLIIFRKQLELAIELELPVVIHMRNAEMEMMQVLENMRVVPRGQFHCFAGSERFLKYVLKRGFYVSFAGNITYKSAGALRELLKTVPKDRLLLETDSPYLPPEPLRGTVNRPANVKITAEFIARELNTELNLLAEITTKNAKCLYCLDI